MLYMNDSFEENDINVLVNVFCGLYVVIYK